MRVRWRGGTAASLVIFVLVAGISGCGWHGLNTLPLPGTQGTGADSFVIQAQMPDVNNIQPNSRDENRAPGLACVADHAAQW